MLGNASARTHAWSKKPHESRYWIIRFWNKPHESHIDKLWLTLGEILQGPVWSYERAPHCFAHTVLHAKQICHTRAEGSTLASACSKQPKLGTACPTLMCCIFFFFFFYSLLPSSSHSTVFREAVQARWGARKSACFIKWMRRTTHVPENNRGSVCERNDT